MRCYQDQRSQQYRQNDFRFNFAISNHWSIYRISASMFHDSCYETSPVAMNGMDLEPTWDGCVKPVLPLYQCPTLIRTTITRVRPHQYRLDSGGGLGRLVSLTFILMDWDLFVVNMMVNMFHIKFFDGTFLSLSVLCVYIGVMIRQFNYLNFI